jgi:hypothetical protein
MSLFAELKRRNVVRVGLTYAVIGWVIAQIAEFAFENFTSVLVFRPRAIKKSDPGRFGAVEKMYLLITG